MSKASGNESNSRFTRASLFDLTGKTALVTGGGSGIGLMATQALAANGARVYITGRTQEKLDTVVSTYGGDKVAGEIIAIPADVTDKAQVAKLADTLATKEPNGLHILVNNAGVSSAHLSVPSDSAEEMRKNLFDDKESTFDDWLDTYKTNVAPIFFVTVALLPLLKKSAGNGWAAGVINITSISGYIKSAQNHFSYNASKAAAAHVSRMLAAEIAEHHGGTTFRVNAIAPGVFPSEMTAGDSDEKQKSEVPHEKIAGTVPADRPGRDEDMAQAVLFCAANQYLNGQTITVDGGYTLKAGL